MLSAAIPYGATELKQVAQRYWMFGFILSAFLHVSLVAAFQLRWIRTDDIQIPTDVDHRTIEFNTPTRQMINGVVEPPAAPKESVIPRPKDGTPVPVNEALVPKDQTFASQKDRIAQVSPGNVDLPGGVAAIPPVIEDEEANTPIFKAVEKYPDLVSSARPAYPEQARLAGLEGKVLVRMLVGKDGKVKKVVVEQSTFDIFNDAACDAAMKFVFTPAYNAGGPVTIWVHIPFVFKLR